MKKNTLFTIVILSVVVPLIIILSVSQGLASGNPVEYSSWQSGDVSSECAKAGGLPEGVKLSSLSSGAKASSSNNTITIKNVNLDGEQPMSFSWSSTSGVGAVIVVANSGANVWLYNPQKSSGSGLYGYGNGSIDHVTFCWSSPPDPTNTLMVLSSSTATEVISDTTNTPTASFTHTETSTPPNTPTEDFDYTPTPTIENIISETPTQTNTEEVKEEEETPTPTETVIVSEETTTPTPTQTMVVTEEPITPTPTQTATEIEETDTPEPTPTFTPEMTASPTPEFTPTPTALEPKPEPAIQLSIEVASINGDPDVKKYFQVGDQVTYSVTVINTGNVDLMNVSVSDPLQTISGDPIDILAAGVSNNTNFSASYIITQDDVDRGSLTNIFTVMGTPSKGNIITDEATITLNGSGENPSLQLVKEVVAINDNPSAKYFKEPGDKITYRFTVTNTGNVTLTNITISDPLATVSEGIIEFLDPGESDSETFFATYIINEEDYYDRLFKNTATVSGWSLSGSIVTDEAVVTVEREQRQLY